MGMREYLAMSNSPSDRITRSDMDDFLTIMHTGNIEPKKDCRCRVCRKLIQEKEAKIQEERTNKK